jgi:hypothetical protein
MSNEHVSNLKTAREKAVEKRREAAAKLAINPYGLKGASVSELEEINRHIEEIDKALEDEERMSPQ